MLTFPCVMMSFKKVPLGRTTGTTLALLILGWNASGEDMRDE